MKKPKRWWIRSGKICDWIKAILFQPIQRSAHRFLPEPVHFISLRRLQLWGPGAVQSPAGTQVVGVLEETDCQAGCIRHPERGGLIDYRQLHIPIEDGRLKL